MSVSAISIIHLWYVWQVLQGLYSYHLHCKRKLLRRLVACQRERMVVYLLRWSTNENLLIRITPHMILNVKIIHINPKKINTHEELIHMSCYRISGFLLFLSLKWLSFLQSLLCDPNPNSPANSEAARMFSENKREYNRRVREIVEQSWTAD